MFGNANVEVLEEATSAKSTFTIQVDTTTIRLTTMTGSCLAKGMNGCLPPITLGMCLAYNRYAGFHFFNRFVTMYIDYSVTELIDLLKDKRDVWNIMNKIYLRMLSTEELAKYHEYVLHESTNVNRRFEMPPIKQHMNALATLRGIRP